MKIQEIMLKNRVCWKHLFISIYCISLSGLSALFSGCATYSQLDKANQRISCLEQRNEILEKNIAEVLQKIDCVIAKENDSQERYAEIHAFMDQAQEYIRVINGKLEEYRYLINNNILDSYINLIDIEVEIKKFDHGVMRDFSSDGCRWYSGTICNVISPSEYAGKKLGSRILLTDKFFFL